MEESSCNFFSLFWISSKNNVLGPHKLYVIMIDYYLNLLLDTLYLGFLRVVLFPTLL